MSSYEDFEDKYGSADPRNKDLNPKPSDGSRRDPFDWRKTPEHKARLKEWRAQQAIERDEREVKARKQLDSERVKEIKAKLQTHYSRKAMHIGTPEERLAELRKLAEQARGGAA